MCCHDLPLLVLYSHILLHGNTGLMYMCCAPPLCTVLLDAAVLFNAHLHI